MSKNTELEHAERKLQPWVSILSLIATGFAFLSGLYATISDVLRKLVSEENLLLTKLGVVFFCQLIIVEVICLWITRATKSVDNTGLVLDGRTKHILYRFTSIQRIIAWRTFIIYPFSSLLFLLFVALTLSERESKCVQQNNRFSITVSKFSDSTNDGFSETLFNHLNNAIDTSISIDYKKKYLPPLSSIRLQDSLISLLDCHQRGMVIYGRQNASEKSFYCNIYLHNLKNKCSTVTVKSKTIFIQDPKLIEIQNTNVRAQIIGDFIQALLSAYQCNLQQSNNIVNDLLGNSEVQACEQLAAYCYLILGNNLARMQRLEDAINAYNSGLNRNRYNKELIANLAQLEFF